MKTPLRKSKKGFTIIEVSLVLAIGGLIMLMVFIAWPAVQRNQRDSQRRTTDLPRLFTSITNYMTNNKGALPTAAETQIEGSTNKKAFATVTGSDELATGDAGWARLYNNYILAENDTFDDPAGNPYNLEIISCSGNPGATFAKPNNGLTAGAVCTSSTNSSETTTITNGTSTTTQQKTRFNNGTVEASFSAQENVITIVIGATCDGEIAKAATGGNGGNRKFAILYRLESGGVFCQSN